jgi:hypothetical protein
MECAHDGRAAFARCFALHLSTVRDLRDAGEFGEASIWAGRLALEAAQGYLRALDGWDRGDFAMTPAPWRLIFSVLKHGAPLERSVIRASGLAHATYDLPLAIARTGVDERARGRQASAFGAITDALGESIALTSGLPVDAACGADVVRRAWCDGAALAGSDPDHRQRAYARIEAASLLGVSSMLRKR